MEPSAGRGAIALEAQKAGAKVWCVEINPESACELKARGLNEIALMDFLTIQPDTFPPFDRVLMNPPFTNDQDIQHVMHAYHFLTPGGKLYAIMSPGFQYGQNKRRTAFREFLAENGRIVKELDSGAFKESGTMVRTVIIELTR